MPIKSNFIQGAYWNISSTINIGAVNKDCDIPDNNAGLFPSK